MLFSIVICTYNRSNLLLILLESIACQTAPTQIYEVIVVDNNSSDATPSVVKNFMNGHPGLNIRYAFEKKQGVSNARNRGWQEARGEYVAYLDDDCKLPPYWGTTLIDIIQRFSPGVFEGPYYAYYLDQKPEWFQDTYGSYEMMKNPRWLQAGETLSSGGNLVIKKKLLERYQGFNTDLGMKGRLLGYGEEPEFVNRVRENDPDITLYYDPEFWVYHLVRKEKFSIRWNIYSVFTNGKYCFRFTHKGKKLRNSLLYAGAFLLQGILLIADMCYGLIFRNRTTYPNIENYMIEVINPKHFSKLGWYYEAILESLKRT